jgi:hypothetical protein
VVGGEQSDHTRKREPSPASLAIQENCLDVVVVSLEHATISSKLVATSLDPW